MIGLLQRVNWAHVRVDGVETGRIDQGLLVLIGVERGDSAAEADRLVERLLGYRVFSDDTGRMNASVTDTGGGVLLVPQFTLPADTRKGKRPSFTPAAPPAVGEALFKRVVDTAHASGLTVETGVFGADMKVALENDGPVTFWLQVSPPD